MAVPSNYHALYDAGARRRAGRAEAVQRHVAGVRRLTGRVPGLNASHDAGTGMPIQLIAPPDTLLAVGAGTPVDAWTAFVGEHADLWNLSPADLGSISIDSVGGRRLHVVRLTQRVHDAEVFGSEVSVGLDGRNGIVAVSGQFFHGARSFMDAGPVERSRPGTSSMRVIARAVSDLTGQAIDPAEFEPSLPGDRGAYRAVRWSRSSPTAATHPLTRPVRTKNVLFPLGGALFRWADYLEVWLEGIPPFSYVIDAEAPNEILFRNCLQADAAFTYLVHNTGDRLLRPLDSPAPGTPHPTGVPDGSQAPTVAETAITVESLIGDPWLPDEAVSTIGNNCVAYADLSSPDGRAAGDVLGGVTSPRLFAETYDHSRSATATANVQNGIVGMFFQVNWAHDRWYAAGFDEGAGNAQDDNYGRGGLGADPVLAEANDYGGVQNANMSTPADGDSPRMQMYVFPGPVPDRTSNHEALITVHELAHYLSNRLVGNANGLDNAQGRALGEGWSDFLALCMTSQPSDDFANGCFGQVGWCALFLDPKEKFREKDRTFRDNYYYGLRRYPYSARTDKNPLTFRHIGKDHDLPDSPPFSPLDKGKARDNPEFHNAGEVWCSALWEVFVGLVDRHGHTHAERRMLHYVVGGLALTPNQPTYVQARDGIIAAVQAIDRTDLIPVWSGFAKRCMGVNAVAPPSDSTNFKDVVESGAVPAGLPAATNIGALCAINQLL